MLGRKKQGETSPQPLPQQQQPAPRAVAAPATPAAWNTTSTRTETPVRGQMHIGKSVHIKGELTANEEMTIDGAVDGSIVIESHQLTIGTHGRITAEVRAKSIVIHGKVVGNITVSEKAEVRQGGTVEGDIHGPRVILADGAIFKGNIDMGSGPQTSRGMVSPTEKVSAETSGGDEPAARKPDVDDVPAPFTEIGEDVAFASSSGSAATAGKSKLEKLF